MFHLIIAVSVVSLHVCLYLGVRVWASLLGSLSRHSETKGKVSQHPNILALLLSKNTAGTTATPQVLRKHADRLKELQMDLMMIVVVVMKMVMMKALGMVKIKGAGE